MTARRMGIGALLLLTAACARAQYGAPARPAGTRLEGVVAEREAQKRVRQTSGAPELPTEPLQPQRQLIRVGDISVHVEDPRGAATRLEARVTAAGGFVESSQREGDGSSARLELRVPSAMLDAFMDSAAAMGKVRDRSVSAQDVTDQLIDLDARRATLVATRDRLRELLKRADLVRDVVEVERELTRVQGQLDSMDRQLEAMRTRVALSPLTVRLDRPPVLGPLGWVAYGLGKAIEKLFVWRS